MSTQFVSGGDPGFFFYLWAFIKSVLLLCIVVFFCTIAACGAIELCTTHNFKHTRKLWAWFAGLLSSSKAKVKAKVKPQEEVDFSDEK